MCQAPPEAACLPLRLQQSPLPAPEKWKVSPMETQICPSSFADSQRQLPEESLNLCVTLKVGCEDGGCCCPPGLSSGPSDTPFVQTLGRRLGSACLSLEYGGRGVGREGTKPPAGRKMGFSSRTKAEHPYPLPPGQDLRLGVKINSTSTGYGSRWWVGGEES